MTSACKQPPDWQTLVDYYAKDLAPEAEAALEAHLFGCSPCSERATSIGVLVAAMAGALPPVLSPEHLERLRRAGRRILDNPMQPGERKTARFPSDVELLIHRLGGLALKDATRVSFSMRVEDTGHVLVEVAEAPFDRDAGEVLICCQRHFAAMPHDTVAEIRVRDAAGSESSTSYTILHVFE